MTHWRTMLEGNWLTHAHLGGKEFTLEIIDVQPGVVVGDGGKKSKKPVVTFKGARLPFALNATNGKTLERLYGPEVEKWKGRLVTLYTDQTKDHKTGQMVGCIRIRPVVPRGKATSATLGPEPTPDVDPHPGHGDPDPSIQGERDPGAEG